MGNQLSGGEQQMLAIGRALMLCPKLLILDEATEGLAPIIRGNIWQCLGNLKRLGLSILLIDKNLDELAPLADRTYIMEKGRMVWEGVTSALTGTKRSAAALPRRINSMAPRNDPDFAGLYLRANDRNRCKKNLNAVLRLDCWNLSQTNSPRWTTGMLPGFAAPSLRPFSGWSSSLREVFNDLQPGPDDMVSHELVSTIRIRADYRTNDLVMFVKGVLRMAGDKLKRSKWGESLPKTPGH